MQLDLELDLYADRYRELAAQERTAFFEILNKFAGDTDDKQRR